MFKPHFTRFTNYTPPCLLITPHQVYYLHSTRFTNYTPPGLLITLHQVYYVGEVGTGLGPTLEFYTLLSHCFQETTHRMWRQQDTYQMDEKSYVAAPNGLYPSKNIIIF